MLLRAEQAVANATSAPAYGYWNRPPFRRFLERRQVDAATFHAGHFGAQIHAHLDEQQALQRSCGHQL
jgi:hypothetical protein